jgi:hypothetical protein
MADGVVPLVNASSRNQDETLGIEAVALLRPTQHGNPIEKFLVHAVEPGSDDDRSIAISYSLEGPVSPLATFLQFLEPGSALNRWQVMWKARTFNSSIHPIAYAS